MFQYYDKAVRGTEREDMLMILQSLAGLIGERFSFLNYYKEIPVSYDATLMSVENEMAEFAIHEYQAKVINIERKALIHSHPKSPFSEDMVGEAFYVNSLKKRVILCNFAYAKIHSEMRRFVRVLLDRPVEVDLIIGGDILKGNVKDLSLGGAAMTTMSSDLLVPGQEINLSLKLPDLNSNKLNEVAMNATVLNVIGDLAPFTCIIEFLSEKHSQQQISYYINQRQVEIIKELKEISA
ncbi:MAG: PilZ domain-containing protein [Steroidobacteraceae bacterium]|nr:PilZ domain-containing protein [Deltaproteobacteria bacterium]